MSKPIKLSRKQWAILLDRLKEDYPRSVFLMRSKMQKVLGFVDRTHRDYKAGVVDVRLDFYSEKKRTLFILKYTDYLGKQEL